MRCKALFRNIETTRFPTGGGTVRYNMEVNRCTGLVRVWESRHRTVAEIELSTLARIVMDRWSMAQAKEQMVERKRRRLVRRGLLGLGLGAEV
jgi:hypothetical protein